MKELLLFIMLIVVSSSSMAEWALVLTSKEATQYADRSTIRVSGNIAKMWMLTNISKNIENIRAGEKGFAMKTLSEYDCKEEKSRLVHAAFYGEYMGTGGILFTQNTPNTDWMPIVPGHDSISAIGWKIACGK